MPLVPPHRDRAARCVAWRAHVGPRRSSRSTGSPGEGWRRRLGAFVMIASAAAGAGAAADEVEPDRPRVEIGWTETPPTLDGRLDEGEWDDAAYLTDLTQATPDEGAQATQRTEVYVMTDRDRLYVGVRLWDTDPDQIVRNQMRRDADLRRDDRFSLTLDPFLDRQNGYLFQVNANGARRDFLIEGRNTDGSWDGRWYAKTTVDDRGWTLEIAIPYLTISFDPDANVWGMNLARGIRRRDEIDRWADPVRDRFVTSIGRAGDLVGMKGVRQGVGLRVIPSLAVRRVDDAQPPPNDVDLAERHYTRISPSFDAFYKATPSVTTAITANTDFGETEVDDRQVNLSRFALFFPEKRDFFLQDQLIFDFGGLSENGRPFFSRRIGLDADGAPVKLLGGGKVTGRVGPVKFGVLDVLLDENDTSDQQNLFVGRAAVNLGESSIGAILTHGEPNGNGVNTVAGLDFLYRDTDFLDGSTLQGTLWGQVSHNDPDDTPDTGPLAEADAIRGVGYAVGASLRYPNDKHDWELLAEELDDDFDPAMGFVNRTGIRRFRAQYRRRWRPASRAIQTVDSLLTGVLITEQGRQVETGQFVWRAIDLLSPVDDGIRLEYEHRYEAVDTAFTSFSVLPGRYHFDEGRLRFESSPNRRVGGVFLVGYGTFYDGTRLRFVSDVFLRLTRFVQVGVVHNFDNLRLPGGDENIHVLRGRLSLFFTPNISWVTLVQYDTVSDSIGVNSRLRWIIEDGREFFLVLNQGFETRDEVRPTRTAPLAKLQWTFRF